VKNVWQTMVNQGWSAQAAAAYLNVEPEYAKREMDRVRGYTTAQAVEAKVAVALRSRWGARIN
jgi:hypothetical protein